ncbi:MAG: hypothetical protein O7H41_18930 [Planctomycetota bacterium]|nr:hypothetical protein [Planctomycetota bacterium]
MDFQRIIDWIKEHSDGGWPVAIILFYVVQAVFKKKKKSPPPGVIRGARLPAAPLSGRPGTVRGTRRHPVLSEILDETEEVLDKARGQSATAEMVPGIERGFVEPLEKLARQGWRRMGVAEDFQVYWMLLKLGIEQRSSETLRTPGGQLLTDLEVLGEEIWTKTVRALGGGRMPVRRLFPVRVPDRYSLPIHELDLVSSTAVAPLPVPESAGTQVWRWTTLYRQTAHLVWSHQPGLQEELRRKVGAEGAGPIPILALSFFSQVRLAKHLMGVWLPEIFADLITCMAIGPAAAAAARAMHRDLDSESIGLIRGAQVEEGPGGFYYDSRPPPHLQMLLIRRILSRGPFARHAEVDGSRWTRDHGDLGEFLLELPGGYGRAVPIQPFISELERVVDRLLTSRLRSIGGRTLSDLPALGLSFEQFNEIERAVKRPQPDRLEKAKSAAWVIAFAAMAHDQEMADVAKTAHRVLAYHARGASIAEAAPHPVAAVAAGPVSSTDWVRDAIVWREILMPPVSRRPRERLRK